MKQPKKPIGLSKPKIPVKRVFEIADSLEKKSGDKIGAALEIDKTKKSGAKKDWLGRNPEQMTKAANNLWSEGEIDMNNASRYRALAMKAMANKKK